MQPSNSFSSWVSYKVTVMNVFNKKDDRLTGSAFFLLHPASQAVPINIREHTHAIVFNPVFFMFYILSL